MRTSRQLNCLYTLNCCVENCCHISHFKWILTLLLSSPSHLNYPVPGKRGPWIPQETTGCTSPPFDWLCETVSAVTVCGRLIRVPFGSNRGRQARRVTASSPLCVLSHSRMIPCIAIKPVEPIKLVCKSTCSFAPFSSQLLTALKVEQSTHLLSGISGQSKYGSF